MPQKDLYFKVQDEVKQGYNSDKDTRDQNMNNTNDSLTYLPFLHLFVVELYELFIYFAYQTHVRDFGVKYLLTFG